MVRGRDFDRQTIIDNVSLLDDDTLRKINDLIVETGHKGKAHKLVELGKRTLIATDQWHFAIDWRVADHQ